MQSEITVTVSDAVGIEDATCTIDGEFTVTLAAGTSEDFDYECELPANYEPGDVPATNTANASWSWNGVAQVVKVTADIENWVLEGTTDASVEVWDNQTDPENLVLLGTVAVDTATGAILEGEGYEIVDGTAVFTYDLKLAGEPGRCVSHTNTAWVDVQTPDTNPSDSEDADVCWPAKLDVEKALVAAYTATYNWTIDKTTEYISQPDADGNVTIDYNVEVKEGVRAVSDLSATGTITITNPNAWQQEGVTVTDTMTGAACTATEMVGDTPVPFDGVVGAGETVTLDYTCTFEAGYAPGADVTNNVEITWTDTTGPQTASDSETVVWDVTDINPVITVTDIFREDQPVQLGTVTWSEEGKVTPFPVERTVEVPAGTCASVTNEATIVETGQSDSVTDEVCFYRDLNVTKTIEAEYTRTYNWEIAKTVDSVTGPDAENTYTIDYDVTVTPTTAVNSDFIAKGTILIDNPNSIDKVVTVIENPSLGEGAECTITTADYDMDTEGTQVLVPAGEVDFPVAYECEFPDGYQLTEAELSNAVEITWLEGEDVARDTATALVEWDVDPVNHTINVDDYFDGAVTAIHLGSRDWSDGPHTFDHQVKVTVEPGTCVTVNNRAEIHETGQDDDIDTTICNDQKVTVDKSMDASYTKTFNWDIGKNLVSVTGVVDGKATAVFEILVTEKAPSFTELAMKGSVVVTNPNAWAVDVTLADVPAIGGASCTLEQTEVTVPAATADGDGAVTVDYTCTFSEGFELDEDATLTNTVTATWKDSDGKEQSRSDSETVKWDVTKVNETINVDDYYNGSDDADHLGSITWSATDKVTRYEATKTFDVAPGTCETVTNIAKIRETGQEDDASASACDYQELDVSKEIKASYTETFTWDIKKSLKGYDVEAGTIDYDVVVTPKAPEYTEVNAAGTITIVNDNAKSYVVTVVDNPSMGTGVSCEIDDDRVAADGTITIDEWETVELVYTCTFAPGYKPTDAEMSNTVTITWTEGEDQMTDTSTATVVWDDTQVNETITVEDYFNGSETADVLGTVTWNEDLTATTFPVQKEIETAPGTCETITNRGVIKETDQDSKVETEICREADLTVDKTADATYDETFKWSVTKDVVPGSIEILDGTVTSADYTVVVTPEGSDIHGYEMSGTITVENPNEWEKSFTVTDVYDGIECTVTGETTVPAAVDGTPGKVTLAYTCTFGEGFTHTDGLENVATVTWTPLEGEGTESAQGTAPVTWEVDTEIHKVVTVTDIFEETETGLGTVGYDEEGELFATLAEDLADDDAYSVEIVDGTVVYTYTMALDVTADGVGACTTFTNQVEITDGDTTLDEDESTVEVCAEDDLVVAKTATGALTRTYDWTIEKTAVDNVDTIKTGEKVSFPYTVTVTPDGYTDSAWTLEGSVTVNNPNEYKDVEARITDVVSDEAWTCSFESDTVTIAAGESVTLPYTCILAEGVEPELEGTNTVTVEWTAEDGTVQSADFEIGYELTITEVHKTVTITDDVLTDNHPATTLGTATWNAEGTPTVFEYTVDAWKYSVGKHTIENRACIEELEVCDTETVDYEVAPPPKIPPTGANTVPLGATALGMLLLGGAGVALGARRQRA